MTQPFGRSTVATMEEGHVPSWAANTPRRRPAGQLLPPASRLHASRGHHHRDHADRLGRADLRLPPLPGLLSTGAAARPDHLRHARTLLVQRPVP